MTTATEIEKVVKTKGNDGKAAQLKQEDKKLAEPNIFAQQVEQKAYELYLKRGCENGHDCDDWFEAEKLVEAEMIAGK